MNLSRILEKAKALVFDFDGTLVDSNPIKIGAFEKCFASLPSQREEIMGYCREHHHTPRQVKFRHVYEKILKEPYTSETEKKLLACYESHTTEAVIRAPEIPGARRFLEECRGRFQTGLLSSTPHPILQGILTMRNLSDFFDAVQGAPVDKSLWLKSFAKTNRLDKDEMLFFGDTREDAQSSLKAGVPFIAVGGEKIEGALLQVENFEEV